MSSDSLITKKLYALFLKCYYKTNSLEICLGNNKNNVSRCLEIANKRVQDEIDDKELVNKFIEYFYRDDEKEECRDFIKFLVKNILKGFQLYHYVNQKNDRKCFNFDRVMNTLQGYSVLSGMMYIYDKPFNKKVVYINILYAYLDDLLDDKNINKVIKYKLYQKFMQWLQNKEVNLEDNNEHEKILFNILYLINKDYPREDPKNQLFYKECCIAVHKTIQIQLKQQNLNIKMSNDEIMEYTIMKNMCVAKLFYVSIFDEGIFRDHLLSIQMTCLLLQLIDDLEDIDEDLQNNIITLPVKLILEKKNLDGYFIRLVNFYLDKLLPLCKNIQKNNEKITSLLSDKLDRIQSLCGLYKIFAAGLKRIQYFSKPMQDYLNQFKTLKHFQEKKLFIGKDKLEELWNLEKIGAEDLAGAYHSIIDKSI